MTTQARSKAVQDLMPTIEVPADAAATPTEAPFAEAAQASVKKLMAPVLVMPTQQQKEHSFAMRTAGVVGAGLLVAFYQSLVYHGVAPDIATLLQPGQTDPTQVVSAGFGSPVAIAGFFLLRYWDKVRTAGQEMSTNALNLGKILTNA